MKKLFIDIGGTNLRSEITEGTGSIHAVHSSKSQGLLAYIEAQMAQNPDIGFIGIAYAGQVHEGVILSAPNIFVDETAIKRTVESRYGVTLEIDNDLNCALMAEAEFWKVQNMAALYVGTGIGAAVLERGQVICGSQNLAYEIGHIPYREAPFACGCGRKNCIELFASGSGMYKWYQHGGGTGHSDFRRLSSSEKEDERRIAAEFETALAYAAGTLVTLANPELIVLGGGIIDDNPGIIKRLREQLSSYALKASLESLRVEASRLNDAPLMGAKLLEKRKNG